MVRLNALFVTLLGVATAGLVGCTVTVNKGPEEAEAPPPPPPPAETAQPEPAADPPEAAPKPKPKKKYKVDQEGRVNIPGNIVFELDSAKIKEDDAGTQEVLAQLKQFIEDNPRVSKIRIEGHTDSQGDDAHNDQLSVDRALAVKSWLVAHDVDPNRIIAVGFGEKWPVASNDTAEGRAQNRRTEFYIAEIEGKPYLNKPVEGRHGGIVAP